MVVSMVVQSVLLVLAVLGGKLFMVVINAVLVVKAGEVVVALMFPPKNVVCVAA